MKKFLLGFIIFSSILILTACGMSNSDNSNIVEQQDAESVETGTNDNVDEAVNNTVNSVVNLSAKLKTGKVNSDNSDSEELEIVETNKLVIFFLDIDGERFEVELTEQQEYTAYDVLEAYVEKEGISLVTKKYDFGIFIQGIGDKIGDSNNFWLFYVNGKLANSSADTTIVQPGDIIRFEFTSNSPF